MSRRVFGGPTAGAAAARANEARFPTPQRRARGQRRAGARVAAQNFVLGSGRRPARVSPDAARRLCLGAARSTIAASPRRRRARARRELGGHGQRREQGGGEPHGLRAQVERHGITSAAAKMAEKLSESANPRRAGDTRRSGAAERHRDHRAPRHPRPPVRDAGCRSGNHRINHRRARRGTQRALRQRHGALRQVRGLQIVRSSASERRIKYQESGNSRIEVQHCARLRRSRVRVASPTSARDGACGLGRLPSKRASPRPLRRGGGDDRGSPPAPSPPSAPRTTGSTSHSAGPSGGGGGGGPGCARPCIAPALRARARGPAEHRGLGFAHKPVRKAGASRPSRRQARRCGRVHVDHRDRPRTWRLRASCPSSIGPKSAGSRKSSASTKNSRLEIVIFLPPRPDFAKKRETL